MVRLPWFAAHVAEVFATYAGHEVTALGTFDCFLAPGADFSILGDPFGIGLFFQHYVNPFETFFAGAG
jgi:hypothetical protein